MNRCPKCGAYLDPGEKCDCEETTNAVGNTMVMVTRAEYEELVKLRVLKKHVIQNYKPVEGAINSYTCIATDVFENLFPGELEGTKNDYI